MTPSPKWLRSLTWSVIVAALVYLAAVFWAGREGVVAALHRIGGEVLVAVLGLSLLNYALRFARWHVYLRLLGASIAWLPDLRVYISGFALTTTPGKVGEMARTVWLLPYGVPASASLAAFVTERLQDLLAVLALSCFGLSLFPGGRWLLLLAGALVGVVFLGLLMPALSASGLRRLQARGGRLAAIGTRVEHVLQSARGCLTPSRLVAGLLVGLAAWGAEAFAFDLLLRALGSPLPLLTAMSIYSIAMLAGAISSMPGGLGGSEATMLALLSLSGVPVSAAISATLLIRLATLWFAVLLGAAALALRDRSAPASPAAEVQ